MLRGVFNSEYPPTHTHTNKHSHHEATRKRVDIKQFNGCFISVYRVTNSGAEGPRFNPSGLPQTQDVKKQPYLVLMI